MNQPIHPLQEQALLETRRHFFGKAATGIGAAALASLLPTGMSEIAGGINNGKVVGADAAKGALKATHFAPTAKRVIYLFMAGGPSQIDLFDYKPNLEKFAGKDLPKSIRKGQRITTMTSGQKILPVTPSAFKFKKHGKVGAWISELLPHTASIVDDIAIIKTVHGEAINHDPATTLIQTGFDKPGRPSLGAWLSYGLGESSQNLPSFVVLTSSWTGRKQAQALFERLWGTGFISSRHAGIALRSKGDPVLYLADPPGVSKKARRQMLDTLGKLNSERHSVVGDPEIQTRIKQYELAFRMQTSVPELTDISKESKKTLEMYGPQVTKPGTFAASCLLARRLVERDVRFVQIFIRGWDQHNNLVRDLTNQCKDVDQGGAVLIKDLKQRGMLDDTLVVWGGEFGRTVYSQGIKTKNKSVKTTGRDHHPHNHCMWMAGGGVKPGIVHGETDHFSYNVVRDPVHIHDLNATILHCLGIDHERLTYRFQGRDFRLTDVHGNVVKAILK